MFDDFFVSCITCSSMKFVSVLEWMLVSFIIFVRIPFPFAHATCQTLKIFVFTMFLNDFTIQRNMIFMISMIFSLPILALIFDEFWHRCWLHFGIKFHVVWALIFDDFSCLRIFEPKSVSPQKSGPFFIIFRTLFFMSFWITF